MSRSTLLMVGLALWAASSTQVCPAQMVRVGPGFVRAPFAAVDWLPDGRAHVRAPFVNLYTPGFPGFAARAEAEPAADFREMDWQALGQAIWKWSGQLDFDLDNLPNGAIWQERLRTAELADLVTTTSPAPPSDESRQALQEILLDQQNAVDGLAGRRIAALTSFAMLHAALNEYVTPPEERLRRQLFTAAAELNRSLVRFTTGKGWQEYLTVAPGQTLSTAGKEQLPAPGSTELSQALQRFETVEQNPEFQKIASVPEFRTTKTRLLAYLERQSAPAVPMPEELPPPRPERAP